MLWSRWRKWASGRGNPCDASKKLHQQSAGRINAKSESPANDRDPHRAKILAVPSRQLKRRTLPKRPAVVAANRAFITRV